MVVGGQGLEVESGSLKNVRIFNTLGMHLQATHHHAKLKDFTYVTLPPGSSSTIIKTILVVFKNVALAKLAKPCTSAVASLEDLFLT